jgi:hypothetical protein
LGAGITIHRAGDDVAVATVDATDTGQSGSALKITLTADATDLDAAYIIKSLQFNSATAGEYAFTLKVWDGFVFSNSSTFEMRSPAVVTGVSATTADGTYGVGDAVSITVTFDKIVGVDTTGGTPQLTLETGTTDRVATYASGTGSSTLTFTYTVQAGDTATDLDFTATTALDFNSGTIIDAASGANAVLTLPAPAATGSLGANKALVIDGNAPTDIALSNASVSTSAGLNAAVGSLGSTDATVSDSFTYALVAGAGDTDNGSFNISGAGLRATDAGALSAGSKAIRVQTTDAAGNTFIEQMTVTVTSNTAPILDATKAPSIHANSATPTDGSLTGAILLSDIIKNGGTLNNYSDAEGDPAGIAITGKNTNGTLYYSTNSGATWTAVGTVSETSAQVLKADATTYLYFKSTYNGAISDALTFKAWDQTGSYTNAQTGVDTVGGFSLAGTVDTSGLARGVAISGNYAYVADSSSGLQIIDLSTNTIVGTVDTSATGTASDVAVSGNYAYVADGDPGLKIINISTPNNPTVVGTYNTSGTAFGVAVSGNYAYVADALGGLQIINIGTPASPTLVTTFATSGAARGVTISGNYAYVAAGTGLEIIDISTPASPILVALTPM